MPDEIADEINRLKMKKVEIANKINLSDSFDDREEYTKELERIQKQIDILERMKR